MTDILEKIARGIAADLAEKKLALPEKLLYAKAEERLDKKRPSLRAALKKEGVSVIAEVKKASPSKGIIRSDLDPAAQARSYESSGASAVSVLTEERCFLGSLNDLAAVVGAVTIPVLRKDFIIDPYQVLEAAAAGADALLLIARLLPDPLFSTLLSLTEKLGLEALCEAHTKEEAERLLDLGVSVIGVNCRDLRTFQVFPERTEEVLSALPAHIARVAESGIKEPGDLRKYPSADGFLIGEALVRAADPGRKLREFLGSEKS